MTVTPRHRRNMRLMDADDASRLDIARRPHASRNTASKYADMEDVSLWRQSEGRAAEFRHTKLDLPGPGDELSGVVAAAVGLPARRSHIVFCPDKPGRFLVEQRVERLLDGLPHQILYVLAQQLLVD